MILSWTLLMSWLLGMVSARSASDFQVVVFTCIWKRPTLTEFVLGHYAKMAEGLRTDGSGIAIELFIVGSEGDMSRRIAEKYQAKYLEYKNEPLGEKHNAGLRAVGDSFPHLDALVVIGSDDILNIDFFHRVRTLMTRTRDPMHVVGLRDIYFYDIATDQLAYTAGYTDSKTALASTIGLGRTFSRGVLEIMSWSIWEADRNRGLDQSAVRTLLTRIPTLDIVVSALDGRALGILAVDLKSHAIPNHGTNLWSFQSIMDSANHSNSRLRPFELHKSDKLRSWLPELTHLRTTLLNDTPSP